MSLSDKAEEILESLWIVTEEQGDNSAPLDTLGIEVDGEALVELQGLAFVELKGERVYLRAEGRGEARMAVRRHRLAERLIMDVLDYKGVQGDEIACEFEHLLRHGVDTKLCTLLNHPTTCPHGRPIPVGECCHEARTRGNVGVVSLTEFKAGESGEIAYLSTDDEKKMQKLMSMGVLPGSDLRVTRTFPSYIFKVGHSEFAVDTEMAREIFIRKNPS